jgi:prepilin-type N-terminal cleavage/methylation domain-containing protein
MNTFYRYQAYKHGDGGDDAEMGFTLIELLIVIVVLGILAAVTVFALSGTTAKSASAACDADAQTVNVALEAFAVQYPTTVATAGSGGNLVTTNTLVTTSYLQSWPANSSHYTIGLSATLPQSVTVAVIGPPAVAALSYPGTPDPCAAVK